MNMIYSKKFIVITALFFSAASLIAPSSVGAIEYGGLGIFPHVSEVDPANALTKAWFIYTTPVGSVKKGKVQIVNTSRETVEVNVYPVDAVTTRDGAFAPEPEDKKKIGIGLWTHLAESELLLKPGESKIVDFTISIPQHTEVGDHMGAIIVQNKKRGEELSGSGIQISTRVGVRIYVTVPGEIVKELVFKEFIQDTQERVVTFSSTFLNKGNVRIRLRGSVEVTDDSGVVVGSVEIPEREVFPGKSITIPVPWVPEDSVGGDLTARAQVVYGTGQSIEKELDFFLTPLKKSLSLSLFTSIGLGVGVGVGGMLLLMAFLYFVFGRKTRRRRRRRRRIDL